MEKHICHQREDAGELLKVNMKDCWVKAELFLVKQENQSHN